MVNGLLNLVNIAKNRLQVGGSCGRIIVDTIVSQGV